MDAARFAALLEAVAAHKDRVAFAELFAFYAPRVKSFMLRLGATDAEAEEIAQDVMIQVWRKAELFDVERASVSTWIFRIARNRRIDLLRRAGHPPDPAELEPEPAILADEALSVDEQEKAVRKALFSLPHGQFELVRASFYEGLSHSEIAERWNLPLGTVKSRIRLALGKLRSGLTGETDN